MPRHFLLDHLRRDSWNTLAASLVALGAGAALVLLPQGGDPSTVGLRAAGARGAAAPVRRKKPAREATRPGCS